MPQDARETSQSGIKDIAIFICLGHMHIRTAYAASLNFDQHFIVARGRDVVFPDLKAGITPN